jgi:hypothetical protein
MALSYTLGVPFGGGGDEMGSAGGGRLVVGVPVPNEDLKIGFVGGDISLEGGRGAAC